MRGAKIAHGAKKPMRGIAATLRGLGRIGARATSRAAPSRPVAVKASVTLDPRVEPVVRDVDGEVRDWVDDRREKRDAEDGREIEADGRRRRIAAQSRPAEDRLRQYGAGQQAAEREPDDRDGRDERVAETVSNDDEPFGETLRARGPHVVLTERSEEHTSELQSPCNLVC